MKLVDVAFGVQKIICPRLCGNQSDAITDDVASMARNLHAIEQMLLRRHHRDGVGRLNFDFYTGTAVVNQTLSMDAIIEEITEELFTDEVQSMSMTSMSLL